MCFWEWWQARQQTYCTCASTLLWIIAGYHLHGVALGIPLMSRFYWSILFLAKHFFKSVNISFNLLYGSLNPILVPILALSYGSNVAETINFGQFFGKMTRLNLNFRLFCHIFWTNFYLIFCDIFIWRALKI